jgi:hypothetical protein
MTDSEYMVMALSSPRLTSKVFGVQQVNEKCQKELLPAAATSASALTMLFRSTS